MGIPEGIQELRFGPIRRARTTPLASTPYCLGGHALYVVGTLDGSFPPLGWHLPGEMGGVWIPPWRALGGFGVFVELELQAPGDAGPRWVRWPLTRAGRVRHGFTWAEFEFNVDVAPARGQDGLTLKARRRDVVPLDAASLISRLTVVNAGERPVRVRLGAWVELSGRPAWGTALPRAPFRVELGSGGARATHGPLQLEFALEPAAEAVVREGPRLEWRGAARELPPGARQRLTLYVSAEPESAEGAPQGRLTKSIREGERHLRRRAFRGVRLECPDRALEDAFRLAKANLELLLVKTPALGRHPRAGVPEYVQLFGTDTAYAVPGLVIAGLDDAAREALLTLARLAEARGGRVPHEVALDGTVVCEGNAVEVPQFVSACWAYARWTGDVEFLRRVYPVCRAGLEALCAQDPDGDGYPDGEGMVERPGLGPETLDVACHLWRALRDLAAMARALHPKGVREQAQAEALEARAEGLRRGLLRDWWLDAEGLFADSLDVRNLPQLQGHWTGLVPLALGLLDGDDAEGRRRARRVLERFRRDWTNAQGYGPVHTRGADERVWTLPAGLLALAEFRYGSAERGVQLLRAIADTLEHGMLGAYAELIPDGGDLMQLWSAALFLQGVVEGLWGVEPHAPRGELRLRPRLPGGWAAMALRELRVGPWRVDLSLTRGRSPAVRVKGPEGARLRVEPVDGEEA